MKHTKIYIILLIALFGLFAVSNSVLVGSASSNTAPVVEGTITDAYYANLNNQSYYDIVYNMSFNISDFTSTNTVNGYYFTLLVGLTYPDGTTYWCQFNLISYQQTFTLQVIWYDSVTQSGWYTAQSYTYPMNNHNNAYYSSFEFDPPSAGVGGASPTG